MAAWKKTLPVLSIVCIVSAGGAYFTKEKQIDIVDPTFLEQEIMANYQNTIQELNQKPDDFSIFYLLFDQQNLDTKNFKLTFQSFFDQGFELEIKEIYPYFLTTDPLPKKYTIGQKDSDMALQSFQQQYIQALEEQQLTEEAEKVKIYGIKIKLISVTCSNQSMYQFLKEHPKIKYSTSLDQGFFTF